MAGTLHRLISMSSPEMVSLAEATRRDGNALVAVLRKMGHEVSARTAVACARRFCRRLLLAVR